MANKLIDWYKPLPAWGKAIVIIGGASVVVYTGYSIIHSINAAKERKLREAELNQFKTDLDNLASQGVYPSFPESQYLQWKDKIISSFTGCDPTTAVWVPVIGNLYSTSGKAVFEIVSEFQNNADFLALQTAYGNQTIGKHWWCGSDIDNQTLTGAVTDQLSALEVGWLNELLKSKNITYKF